VRGPLIRLGRMGWDTKTRFGGISTCRGGSRLLVDVQLVLKPKCHRDCDVVLVRPIRRYGGGGLNLFFITEERSDRAGDLAKFLFVVFAHLSPIGRA